MAPKPIDAQALAEDVRKLIKRVDELEIEKKNLVKKSAEHDTQLTVLRNRGNDLQYKAEMAEKRSLDLESKLKAVDHNALARLSNSRLPNPNTPLTPLHDLNTNLPLKSFPKHERDVRLMSAPEVLSTLSTLSAPTSGNTGEQKSRVKEYIGLPPPSAQSPKPASSSVPPEIDGATPAPQATAGAQKPATPAPQSTTGAQKPAAGARPQMKRTMTMEERKAAGIKAAREKAENDRKMGGRAVPRAKKAGNAEGVDGVVDGAKGGKDAKGGKGGKDVKVGKEAKEINGAKGGKEVNGEVDGKAA